MNLQNIYSSKGNILLLIQNLKAVTSLFLESTTEFNMVLITTIHIYLAIATYVYNYCLLSVGIPNIASYYWKHLAILYTWGNPYFNHYAQLKLTDSAGTIINYNMWSDLQRDLTNTWFWFYNFEET